MIFDLTSSLAQEIVDKSLQHGSIIKTHFLCQDGKSKPKFCIILNHDVSRDPLFYALTTSHLTFHNNNPQYKKQIIRIGEKELPCFPKMTVIDCMRLLKLTKAEITTRYMRCELTFCGVLPGAYLTTIDNIIKTSPFISDFQRATIFQKRSVGTSC